MIEWHHENISFIQITIFTTLISEDSMLQKENKENPNQSCLHTQKKGERIVDSQTINFNSFSFVDHLLTFVYFSW